MSRLLTDSRSILTPGRSAVSLFMRSATSKPVPEIGKTTYVYKNLPEPGSEFEENEYLPRRLSYWPPGLKQHRPRDRSRPWYKIKARITLYPPEEDMRPEYTDEPQYPEITDYEVGSLLSMEKKRRLQWYDSIRKLPAVTQKMMEITGTDRQHALRIRAWSSIFNNLSQYQNMTRTNLIRGLPDSYNQIDVSDVRAVARDAILDAVALSFGESGLRTEGRMRRPRFEALPKHLYPDVIRCDGLLMDLTNIGIKACVSRAPHLMDCQTDLNPEVQSFWYLRQMDLPNTSNRFTNPGTHMPHSNTAVLFQDLATVNIRSQNPLPQILDVSDETVVTESFPATKRNPARDGFPLARQRVGSHAGFWPETDKCDFPFLTVYPLHVLKFREYLAGEDMCDTDSAIDAMGMMFSYAWCNSMALYHGFTPYDEVTYPFTTQTICTDGQTWNFAVYQMNTHSFHGDLPEPTKCNVCWSSGPLKLFEGVENGKLVGVNESVIDLFLKFLLREPSTTPSQVPLRPYLGLDTRTDEERADCEERLRRWFGQCKSQRERYYHRMARTDPIEWILCEKNPHAPSCVHFRRRPKYLHLMKRDRNKLTI